jgi:hypothetical protein
MATWAQFAAAEPDMATAGAALLVPFRIVYLATVRADGAPRVHPVSPFIVEGRLIVATPLTSPKARDQMRDGRYVMHALPGDEDFEFRIRGRSRLVEPGPLRIAILQDGPHFVQAKDRIFEYDIEQAATAYWVNVGQPGTYPVRRSWRVPR